MITFMLDTSNAHAMCTIEHVLLCSLLLKNYIVWAVIMCEDSSCLSFVALRVVNLLYLVLMELHSVPSVEATYL